MTACAIRYRLDGPGPATFLVDCDGELRVYARGVLGGVMPASRVLATVADRGCRWVPAAGRILLDADDPASDDRPPGWAPPAVAVPPSDAGGAGEAPTGGA